MRETTILFFAHHSVFSRVYVVGTRAKTIVMKKDVKVAHFLAVAADPFVVVSGSETVVNVRESCHVNVASPRPVVQQKCPCVLWPFGS
jgi:hypothetical protein